jgi:hypothetical protein
VFGCSVSLVRRMHKTERSALPLHARPANHSSPLSRLSFPPLPSQTSFPVPALTIARAHSSRPDTSIENQHSSPIRGFGVEIDGARGDSHSSIARDETAIRRGGEREVIDHEKGRSDEED